MIKKIIIINGKGKSGKDTICEITSKYYSAINVSSVDAIKSIAKNFGWKDDKSVMGRKFLSDLKQASVNYNNFPMNTLLEDIEKFLIDREHEIMFIHIREPSEINKMVKYFKDNNIDHCTLKIVRDKTKGKVYGNISDDMVDEYDYDYIFYNREGLEILEREFISFLNKEILK